MANVYVQIISRANNSGFASASRSLARFASFAAVGTAAVAGLAAGAVAVGTALAGVGAIGAVALGVVLAGMDGIKQAAKSAQAQFDSFKASMSSEFASGMVAGFSDLGSVLDTITPQMQGVARSISGVFNGMAATVKDNAGGLQQLADKAAQFITALGPGLNAVIAKMIQFGASINVESLLAGFRQVGEFLGPLMSLFGQLAAAGGGAMGMFGALGAIITAITPALVQVATVLGPVLTQTLTALQPAIGALAGAFATVVAAVAPALPIIASLVASLVGALGPALPVIVGAFLAFGAAMKVAAAAIVVYNAIVKAVVIATKIWTAIQTAFNIVMMMNPIGLIIIAIVALIAIIVLIATKTQWFQNIWSAMCSFAVTAWNWIKAAVVAFVGWFVGILASIAAGAISAWQSIQSAAASVWSAIQSVVDSVASFIGSAIAKAVAIVVSVFQNVQSVGQSVFGAIRGVIDTVAGAISTVVGWVQQLISWISQISWPSPPGWMSAMFSGGGFGAPIMPGGPSTFFRPPPPGDWTLPGRSVNLAQGMPDLGRLGRTGGGVVVNNDNRTIVNVDGTGAVDPQRVARSVTHALGRNAQTRGMGPAVRLG